MGLERKLQHELDEGPQILPTENCGGKRHGRYNLTKTRDSWEHLLAGLIATLFCNGNDNQFPASMNSSGAILAPAALATIAFSIVDLSQTCAASV